MTAPEPRPAGANGNGRGLAVLAAYAAVLAGFGSWRTVRSDIS